MTDLKTLAAAAADAETQLRVLGAKAAGAVRTARGELRQIEANWQIPPSQKVEGKRQQRTGTHNLLQAFELTRKQATRAVNEYVKRARILPPVGDAAAEMRRSRAYQAIDAALQALQTHSHREARFVEIVQQADAVHDTATLEAARELGRHLQLRGYDIPGQIIDRLDTVAGPTETRAAMELAERAKTASQAAAITINEAGGVLDEPLGQECILLGLEPDGQTTFRIDPWEPPRGHAAVPGDAMVTEGAM